MNYTVGFGQERDILVTFTDALIPMDNAHPLSWNDEDGKCVPDYSRTMFWDVRDKETYERPCTYGIHFPDKTFYIGRTKNPLNRLRAHICAETEVGEKLRYFRKARFTKIGDFPLETEMIKKFLGKTRNILNKMP